jgi:hypothetical protein
MYAEVKVVESIQALFGYGVEVCAYSLEKIWWIAPVGLTKPQRY